MQQNFFFFDFGCSCLSEKEEKLVYALCLHSLPHCGQQKPTMRYAVDTLFMHSLPHCGQLKHTASLNPVYSPWQYSVHYLVVFKCRYGFAFNFVVQVHGKVITVVVTVQSVARRWTTNVGAFVSQSSAL